MELLLTLSGLWAAYRLVRRRGERIRFERAVARAVANELESDGDSAEDVPAMTTPPEARGEREEIRYRPEVASFQWNDPPQVEGLAAPAYVRRRRRPLGGAGDRNERVE